MQWSSSTGWSARRLLALLAVVVVVGPALAPAASASPRPVSVCAVCSDRALGNSAQSFDLAVAVESSSADVRVHENASATWDVRVQLSGAGVDDLQSDSALTTRLVEAALAREAVAVSARVDGTTLHARYRTPEFATHASGAYRLDGLRNDPGRTLYTGLGADRLTIVGPAGTTTALSPPGASVDGRRVTLTEFRGGWTVFAPAGPMASVVGVLAVGDSVAPVVLSNLLRYLFLPGAVLLGGLLAALRVGPTVAERTRAAAGGAAADAGNRLTRRVRLLVALGFLAIAHPLLVDVQPLVNDYSPLLFGGGVATVLLGGFVAVRGDRTTLHEALAAGVAATVGGALCVLFVPPFVGGPFHVVEGIDEALRATLPVLPVVCCLPLGIGGEERRRLGLGVVVAAFAAVVVTSADLLETAFFGLLATVLFVAGAAAVVVCGLPFLAVGRAVADAGD